MKRESDPVIFWRSACIVLIGTAICQSAYGWPPHISLPVVSVGLSFAYLLSLRKYSNAPPSEELTNTLLEWANDAPSPDNIGMRRNIVHPKVWDKPCDPGERCQWYDYEAQTYCNAFATHWSPSGHRCCDQHNSGSSLGEPRDSFKVGDKVRTKGLSLMSGKEHVLTRADSPPVGTVGTVEFVSAEPRGMCMVSVNVRFPGYLHTFDYQTGQLELI